MGSRVMQNAPRALVTADSAVQRYSYSHRSATQIGSHPTNAVPNGAKALQVPDRFAPLGPASCSNTNRLGGLPGSEKNEQLGAVVSRNSVRIPTASCKRKMKPSDRPGFPTGSLLSARVVFNRLYQEQQGKGEPYDNDSPIYMALSNSIKDEIRRFLYHKLDLERGKLTFRAIRSQFSSQLSQLQRRLLDSFPVLGAAQNNWIVMELVKEAVQRDKKAVAEATKATKAKKTSNETSATNESYVRIHSGASPGHRGGENLGEGTTNPQEEIDEVLPNHPGHQSRDQRTFRHALRECSMEEGSFHANLGPDHHSAENVLPHHTSSDHVRNGYGNRAHGHGYDPLSTGKEDGSLDDVAEELSKEFLRSLGTDEISKRGCMEPSLTHQSDKDEGSCGSASDQSDSESSAGEEKVCDEILAKKKTLAKKQPREPYKRQLRQRGASRAVDRSEGNVVRKKRGRAAKEGNGISNPRGQNARLLKKPRAGTSRSGKYSAARAKDTDPAV